ncbi:hypothetical protein Pan1_97 [Pseudanabaena phage Pan1]|nr:hypothetical protein Pan1_97 [Pseudanabaena phage Pan1]
MTWHPRRYFRSRPTSILGCLFLAWALARNAQKAFHDGRQLIIYPTMPDQMENYHV